jgi:hypothetical protein
VTKVSINRGQWVSAALALGVFCMTSTVVAQSTDQDVVHAAERFKAEIDDVNSGLKDPKKQRFTDVSGTVEKYIPVGSSLANAEALLRAAGCKDIFKTGGCKLTVTTSSHQPRSLGAMFQLASHFPQARVLRIDAQATDSDQGPMISSLRATIDIRTVANL